ncbi:UNKNOWN [Stylonychia lemnae]|uniref:Transmembrane protein n=1 Tax=Stylonychia lemnae TaxID=5949 RepID=A0A078A3M5_STYLE|nr:UNKNOWN [Stylonychia lemnae]|eukprot:CDW76782.1 UNKNOWN [Stylonychia lemnae]
MSLGTTRNGCQKIIMIWLLVLIMFGIQISIAQNTANTTSNQTNGNQTAQPNITTPDPNENTENPIPEDTQLKQTREIKEYFKDYLKGIVIGCLVGLFLLLFFTLMFKKRTRLCMLRYLGLCRLKTRRAIINIPDDTEENYNKITERFQKRFDELVKVKIVEQEQSQTDQNGNITKNELMSKKNNNSVTPDLGESNITLEYKNQGEVNQQSNPTPGDLERQQYQNEDKTAEAKEEKVSCWSCFKKLQRNEDKSKEEASPWKTRIFVRQQKNEKLELDVRQRFQAGISSMTNKKDQQILPPKRQSLSEKRVSKTIEIPQSDMKRGSTVFKQTRGEKTKEIHDTIGLNLDQKQQTIIREESEESINQREDQERSPTFQVPESPVKRNYNSRRSRIIEPNIQ